MDVIQGGYFIPFLQLPPLKQQVSKVSDAIHQATSNGMA